MDDPRDPREHATDEPHQLLHLADNRRPARPRLLGKLCK